jgi:hypothetical protein
MRSEINLSERITTSKTIFFDVFNTEWNVNAFDWGFTKRLGFNAMNAMALAAVKDKWTKENTGMGGDATDGGIVVC